MKTKIYLLTFITLLCISCKDNRTTPQQTEVSTIDTTIQKIAESALCEQLDSLQADAGIVIVMDVETETIKAIANRNFSENDSIEFGGLFSVASMMIALDDSIISPSDEIDTGNGTLEYGDFTVRDHYYLKGGLGEITAEEVILVASNVGIAKIILKGYESNPLKYIEGVNKLGFTNIPKYDTWKKTTLPWLSFGYEVKVTPLQILQFYNSIASNKVNCSASTLQAIQQMLVGVVENGTGKSVKSDNVLIAGKTGTVHLGDDKQRVSFCGYFPADNPKYSCIVMLDNPKGIPSSGLMAGGLFKEIAEKISQ